MDRFEYSPSTLLPNESYIIRSYNVRLYDGDNKTTFDKGETLLTSHRLLWCVPGDGTYLSLHLKYVIYFEEEKPSGFVFATKSKRLILYVSEPVPNRGPGPAATSIFNFVKLSFRDRIDAEFVSVLSQVLEQKRWETAEGAQQIATVAGVGAAVANRGAANIKLRTGIAGIERGLEEKQKATNESISVAFQDLNKLMIKAKEMVTLSKSISTKLKEKQGDITDDETIKFKSYLLSLGVEDPVTRDAFRSEAEYFRKLAAEITQIIETPLAEVGGIMALPDAYCRVNRARGLELLSPEDFLSGCKMLEIVKLPVILRQFESGVKVLQSVNHSDDVVVEDTYGLLKENNYLSAEELSKMVGISVTLAKERLTTTEKLGKACRDESIEGLRFYRNRFFEE